MSRAARTARISTDRLGSSPRCSGPPIPSAVGYQPTLATDRGVLQERITTTHKGSVTSVQAIYVRLPTT
jgi:hypothetical protein